MEEEENLSPVDTTFDIGMNFSEWKNSYILELLASFFFFFFFLFILSIAFYFGLSVRLSGNLVNTKSQEPLGGFLSYLAQGCTMTSR